MSNTHNAKEAEKTPVVVHDAGVTPGMPEHAPKASVSKRVSVKKIAIIVVASLLAVGALAAVLWYFVIPEPVPAGQASTPETELAQVQQVVGASTIDAQGDPVLAASVTSLGGQTEDGSVIYEFAPYKVDSASFKVLPNTGDGTAITVPTADAEARYQAIVKFFDNNTFKKTSTTIADAGTLTLNANVTIAAYTIYANDQTVCSLARLAAKAPQATQLLSVGCAAIASYEEAASAAEPFFTAYSKSNAAAANNSLVFSAPNIQDGSNGQKRAVVFQKDAATSGATIYYTASSGAAWTYLAPAPKGLLDCTVFSSTELKAAFNGAKCYRGAEVSTIE